MISANEARAFTALAKIANRAKSIATLESIYEDSEAMILEAVNEGKCEVFVRYPSDLVHSQFSISELRDNAKAYFGQYGYNVTVPTGCSYIRITW